MGGIAIHVAPGSTTYSRHTLRTRKVTLRGLNPGETLFARVSPLDLDRPMGHGHMHVANVCKLVACKCLQIGKRSSSPLCLGNSHQQKIVGRMVARSRRHGWLDFGSCLDSKCTREATSHARLPYCCTCFLVADVKIAKLTCIAATIFWQARLHQISDAADPTLVSLQGGMCSFISRAIRSQTCPGPSCPSRASDGQRSFEMRM